MVRWLVLCWLVVLMVHSRVVVVVVVRSLARFVVVLGVLMSLVAFAFTGRVVGRRMIFHTSLLPLFLPFSLSGWVL